MKNFLSHFLVIIMLLFLINTLCYSVYAIDPDVRDGTSKGSSGGSSSSSGSSSQGGSSGRGGSTSGGTSGSSSDVTESNWVQKAFSATKSFLTEKIDLNNSSASAPEKMVGNLLTIFKSIVKAINKVLLVALFGISAISISAIGVRYIASRGSPKAIGRAKGDLHTTFIGMAYGFGAFVIWNIAMSIVKLLINALAG